jgi:Ca-activated chloride channel family protein
VTRLAYPWLALLLLVVPAIIYFYIHNRRRHRPTLVYSDVGPLRALPASLWVRLSELPFFLRMAALSLALFALARPQAGARGEEVITEGIDILLTVDVSSSMKTEDFKPKNRLAVAKQVVADFIEARPNDRMGLVVFAARAVTKCPLTIDHAVLATLLEDVAIGSIEDGTAIGTALATSVNRLMDSKAKSRIIILLTDGVNNRGEIDPLTAAELAKTFGIKVYTVGAGREGYAPFPFEDPLYGTVYQQVLVEIDEKTLKEIAARTGGRYFRAQDAEELRKVYREIDALEKTKIEQKQYTRYTELAPYFMAVALGLLLFDTGLGRTRLDRLP